MKDRKHSYRWIVMAIFLASLCCAAVPAAGDDSKRVAIFPFQIHSEKDLSFLQKGIVDMLASRLAQSGKVTVISRQETEQALAEADGPMEVGQAKRIGGELGADYVLFGSLTVFGNSVSIDAKMVDVSGESEPVAVFTQSEMGQVIAEINQFALDINEKVFGHTVAAKEPAEPAGQPTTAPEPGAPRETTPEIYAHPDKLMQSGFGVEATARPGSGYQGLWKSRHFSYTINGLSLGDVDGDGKTEIVVAASNQIFVHRLEGKRFIEIGRSKERNSAFHVGVDTGDIISSDGADEIFVSSLNPQRDTLNSFVLAMEKGKLKTLVENDSRYLRVIALPDRAEAVYGQFQRVAGGPFGSPIDQMEWRGGRFETVQRILPGKRANLLGFAMGDATNSGEDMILYYDSKDRLNLRDTAAQMIWTSGDKFGGSPMYLRIPIEGPGDIENRSYFPMRVRIVDLGDDGSYETIVVKNHEMAGRRLETFRQYNKTQVSIMVWDGIGLSEVWKTRTMSCHIRDFDVGDMDNDGTVELIAAVVLKSGKTIGTKAKSFLMAFDLPTIKLSQEGQ